MPGTNNSNPSSAGSEIEAKISNCTLLQKNIDSLDPSQAKLKAKAQDYLALKTKIDNGSIMKVDIEALKERHYGDTIFDNVLKQAKDYLKIKKGIETDNANNLLNKDVQTFKAKYQGNATFEKLLNKLERKIRQRDNKNLSLMDLTALRRVALFAPEGAQDPPRLPQNFLKYTGVYLWAIGYDVKQCVRYSHPYVIWKCADDSDPTKTHDVTFDCTTCVHTSSVPQMSAVCEQQPPKRQKQYETDIEAKISNCTLSQKNIDSLGTSQAKLKAKAQDYLTIETKINNGTIEQFDIKSFATKHFGDEAFDNVLNKANDYLTIKKGIETADTNNLDNDYVQQLKVKYKDNAKFAKLLNKLERKIRRRDNKNLTMHDTYSLTQLSRIAPPTAQDPTGVALPTRNTGVFLWAKGYDVKRYLGAGTYGTAWACASDSTESKTKVMKVLASASGDEPALQEMEAVNTLDNILEDDNTGKAEKYLTKMRVAKPQDVTMNVIRSELATEDAAKTTAKRFYAFHANRDNPRVDFQTILKESRDALKGAFELHKNGRSHNDIKPGNIFNMSSWKGKIEKTDQITNATKIAEIVSATDSPEDKLAKINAFLEGHETFPTISTIANDDKLPATKKISQISKLVGKKKLRDHRFKLGDVGSMSSIESKLWVPGTYDCKYDLQHIGLSPSNNRSITVDDKEIILKKDVYALGVTLAHFLFLPMGYDTKGTFDHVQLLQLYPESQIEPQYSSLLDTYFDAEAKKQVIDFIKLIKKMVDKDYKRRISLEKALNELKAIIKS